MPPSLFLVRPSLAWHHGFQVGSRWHGGSGNFSWVGSAFSASANFNFCGCFLRMILESSSGESISRQIDGWKCPSSNLTKTKRQVWQRLQNTKKFKYEYCINSLTLHSHFENPIHLAVGEILYSPAHQRRQRGLHRAFQGKEEVSDKNFQSSKIYGHKKNPFIKFERKVSSTCVDRNSQM